MEKKSRILYIQRYLEQQTDEAHPATVADILAWLEQEGVPASRQSIVRDIELLTEAGADIVCDQGKPSEYFMGARRLELPEVKLLVDAVRASRFIPPGKADALIEKLSAFASIHQAVQLRRSLYTAKRDAPTDEKAYITVDLLHTAVNAGKKVTCKYFDWGADKKKIPTPAAVARKMPLTYLL